MTRGSEKAEEVTIMEEDEIEEPRAKNLAHSLEDLPGIGPATADKLRKAGYGDLQKIAASSQHELAEVAEIGVETAKKVIAAARDSLEMGYERADDLLERRKAVGRVTTGSSELDALLGGGVETQSITECYGKFSSGKTQLGFQLAVNVQKPKEKGGLGGGVLIVDTESTFRPERVKQLAEVQGMEQKNLALEMLKKLINDQIKVCEQKNKVAAKSFTELLEKTISQYQNRNIQTVEVIERLIELAKEMKKHDKRGELLNLREDEMAFYDALETNDSAVKVLGDETLRKIARELTETLKRNVKIDWSVRESVKAEIRIAVRKILRKYGYPPDKQEKATQTVLEQAELVAKEWSQ